MPRICIPGGVACLPQKAGGIFLPPRRRPLLLWRGPPHETTPLKNDSFAYHDVWLVQAHGLLSATFRESKRNDSFSLERIHGFLAKDITI